MTDGNEDLESEFQRVDKFEMDKLAGDLNVVRQERKVEDSISTKFYELRGIFTNAIAWAFWGDEERQIINISPKLTQQAREAAERCIRDLEAYHKEKMDQSNLVKHARRELELMHEDENMIEWYLEVILAFVNYGHSGGSASIAIPVINDLLQFKNLCPLTNDPDEWMEVGEELWQNRRNSAAFSTDGGKHHYFVDDPPRLRIIYDTEPAPVS